MSNSQRFRKTSWGLALFFTILVITLTYTLLNTDIFNTQIETSSTARKIVKVIDGDTIEVAKGNTREKVRLIGINTPETVDPRKKVECFGREASNELKRLLDGKSVRLEEDSTQDKEDKYGRSLRYVYLDSLLVNAYMIEHGFAFEYTYNVPYLHQKEFKTLESNAKKEAAGLWSPASCNGKK